LGGPFARSYAFAWIRQSNVEIMRVLHLGKYFPPVKGGMERFLEDLILAQREAGTEAFALVHHAQNAEPIADDPPWLRRVPVVLNISFAPIAPTYISALNKAIEDWKPEYLHLHLPNLGVIAALASPAARRLPWVIHWHADVVSSDHSVALRVFYPLYRPFEWAVLERASLVIATSLPYLETSEPLQAFREKCAVVPLGIDFRRLGSSGDGAQAGPWTLGRFRILAVGRLTYYKGIDTLIAAVAQCPSAELRVVGEGHERAKLHALIHELGVSERVFLDGELSDADCISRYQSADLFCLPSRERTEAFGLVLLEAMHHGLPILASALRGSGVIAIIRAQFNGRLAPVDEPAAWRDAIELLRSSPDDARALAENGKRQVHETYDIATVCERIRRTVDSVVLPDAPRPEAHARPLIVIPARNEAPTIEAVVRSVRSAGYADVLVVDDASSDDTGRIAREAGAFVLRAPLPQGAWGAMQTGIRYAVRHSFTSVITMDADGQHQTNEIGRLLDAARKADVVIGACASRGSPARKFAWRFFRTVTGFSLSDLTSGFRLYNADACKVLAGDEATLIDYQDMGVLLLLRSAKLRLVEVEVAMSSRVFGISRIFYSWGAVTRYMVETTLLCIAKIG
jgi:glycosyltransferase involved in cell wall biosynthesis